MKSFNSPPKVVIIFLTIFIVLCCFLIVRLEIKAANLQSQWDKHQKSLEKDEDMLFSLNKFGRYVDKGGILKIDKRGSIMQTGTTMFTVGYDGVAINTDGDIKLGGLKGDYFGFDALGKITYVKAGKFGDDKIEISAEGSRILLYNDAIKLTSEDKKGGLIIIDANASNEVFYVTYGHSSIRLHRDNINMETTGDINITSENGNVNIKGKKVKVNE